jgi:hypothetical protein
VRTDHAYDYAIIRIVPRVERGEALNAGVILSCPHLDFLDARIEIDEARLMALDETLDLPVLRAHLETIPAICRGGAGPIAELPQRQRFHWLVSPRSTVIQMSAVHTGRTTDPAASLDHLLNTMVRRPGSRRTARGTASDGGASGATAGGSTQVVQDRTLEAPAEDDN